MWSALFPARAKKAWNFSDMHNFAARPHSHHCAVPSAGNHRERKRILAFWPLRPLGVAGGFFLTLEPKTHENGKSTPVSSLALLGQMLGLSYCTYRYSRGDTKAVLNTCTLCVNQIRPPYLIKPSFRMQAASLIPRHTRKTFTTPVSDGWRRRAHHH